MSIRAEGYTKTAVLPTRFSLFSMVLNGESKTAVPTAGTAVCNLWE
ncbi:MAG: hypothetical protein H6652_03175 [Ardenticatenaceae bacterium]|nr:hypothetical protein [Ardenticatenaceae bacterium]MCB8948009.1 hypothetical protein [Ardenticatenaceae bacterium]